MKRNFVPQTFVCLMLLWALNPENPYGYYILLRIVCCAVFAYLAFRAATKNQQGWAWVLGVTAVIYNPILRVHLTREIWSVVNIATIVFALWSIAVLKQEPETKKNMPNKLDAAHDYPHKGVIQKWRRDRADGEVKDLQTGQCYHASISGNRDTHIAVGQSLDGLVVRFRLRTAYQPVEWVSVSDAPLDDEKAIPEIPAPLPPVSVEPPPPPEPPPNIPARPPTPAPSPTPPAALPSNGTIREFIEQRGVTHVYHFTQLSNLAAITQHGLLPRDVLAQRKMPCTFNDMMRLDNAQDSTSVSISFPNYQLFHRFMWANKTAIWVVLAIAPDILWTLQCAFCKTNAASNAVRFRQKETRMTLQALTELFADFPHKKRGNIPHSYPTCPQAEVLVFDQIPATMIRSVCVKSPQDVQLVQPYAAQVECIVNPDVFGKRCDSVENCGSLRAWL